MIEWKEVEDINCIPKRVKYLVSNGEWIVTAEVKEERVVGVQWWDEEGCMRVGITHYAEINLPE